MNSLAIISRLLADEGAACAEQLASAQRSTAGSGRQGQSQPTDLLRSMHG